MLSDLDGRPAFPVGTAARSAIFRTTMSFTTAFRMAWIRIIRASLTRLDELDVAEKALKAKVTSAPAARSSVHILDR
jgi:hypothetical protein